MQRASDPLIANITSLNRGGHPDLTHCQQELSFLGHDLRAALSDILAGLNLIDLTTLDAATLRHVERARVSGETLDRLLDMGLGTLQSGAPSPPTPLATAKLLRDIDLRWSGRAREKGLTFTVTPAANIPPALWVDHFALERVLSNLIGNAIKYTDHGSVTCTLTAGNDTLHFSVTDTGPGFCPSALPHLLAPGNDNSGKGIGLRIAKEMADRLQARLALQNHASGGAEVTLTLPLNPAPGPLPHALPDLTGQKVLLADDSATFQLLVGRMLAQMGAKVVAVTDGPSALAALQEDSFDLALIDIELPSLSGIEVIRALRRLDAPCAQTPVMAVTAHPLHDARASIQSAGADAILPKPVLDAASLGHAIAAILGLRTCTAQQVDTTRFQHLLDMAGPATARELIARLHSDLTAVADGLVRGFANQSWSDLRAQSHILIAVAGVIGATDLQRQAELLNRAAHAHETVSVQKLRATVLPQLDALIRFIAQYPLPTDTAK